jgi:hypothetical protein
MGLQLPRKDVLRKASSRLLDDDVKFDGDVSLCGGEVPSSFLLIMYHLAPYPSRTLTSKTHTPVGSPCVLNQTAFHNDKR